MIEITVNYAESQPTIDLVSQQTVVELVTADIGGAIVSLGAAQSAKGYRDAAQISAAATADDRVQTGIDAASTAADRVQTGLDRVQTGLDADATSDDRVQTGLDRSATESDRIQTGLDADATAADRVQTGSDRSSTASDRTQTGNDRIATAADRVQTSLDADATAADRVQTGLDADATAADRVQTGLDRVATAADRVQTGLDAQTSTVKATAAANSATAANTSAGSASGSAASALAIYGSVTAQQTAVATATAQASLAAGYAASAGSVAQQDLSGVTAAALHRSPNAITAMFVYDTSKDSDGGAWTEKCQHTSWYNETVYGKWLGAQASEANARAVSGATTGSYYQLTTDGKFYTINKNLLLNTAALGTQTVWLAAGSYTLSSTTASSGSVAISGAAMASHTAGGSATTFTVTTSGNVTFTVTGSVTTAQCEPGSSATTYVANTGARITEVFRGNKRSFPKLAGIVAEAANVTIYDLTEPGRPMWRRFVPVVGGSYAMLFWRSFTGISTSSIACINGKVAVGTNGSDGQNSIMVFDLAVDQLYRHGLYSSGVLASPVAACKLGWSASPYSKYLPNIIHGTVNAVAMTVLPDAPVDPVTGLKVPTIAVATDGGFSIIKPDGSVVNNNVNGDLKHACSAKGNHLYASTAERINEYSLVTGVMTTAFANTKYFPSAWQGVPHYVGNSTWLQNIVSSGPKLFIANGNAITATLNNRSTLGRHAVAYLTSAYNTGHMIGDIRRAYLSDITAGSVDPSTELVTNGTFDTDASGWAFTQAGTGGSFSVNSGVLTVTRGDNTTYLSQSFSVVIGKTYEVSFSAPAGGSSRSQVVVGKTVQNSDYITLDSGAPFFRATFVPTSATLVITLVAWGTIIGSTHNFDNISVKEVVADHSYKAFGASIIGTLTKSAVATNAQLVAYSGFSAANYLQEPYSADLDFGTGEWSVGAWVSIPTGNAAAATIASRAYSSGAYIILGIDATNKLTATAYDGTTTRTVTTSVAYNTATWTHANAVYKTYGSLTILVNGNEVAVTRGNPLLTLNNSNAVLTIGNSYALDAPFPGSIALLKLSATVPTAEQALWMYEQEKQLFRDGAQCCLPDSGNIVDLTYDDATDKWIAASATNISEWTGLVRTNVTSVPAGSYSKLSATSGTTLMARTSTNPGVDITIPAQNLRAELVKRAEAAAKLNAQIVTFDYVGGFTATTTNGGTSITGVSGLSWPSQCSCIGAQITGMGIQTGTVITGVNGTTLYISKPATAASSNVQISFKDYVLPVGWETKSVLTDGTYKREGGSGSWNRLFDGFKETVSYGTAPAYNAWVQINAVRSQA